MFNSEEEKRIELFRELNKIDADTDWLFTALCHSSFSNELLQSGNRILQSNERMEFLGDAILELSLADTLYRDFQLSEGDMSKIRAMVGSEKVLHKMAQELKIGDFIFLGKGERLTGGTAKESILADAFEAVLAAIYLSRGFDKALEFVKSRMLKYIRKAVEGKLVLDYKTALQELTQSRFGLRPSYSTLLEEGVPQEKWFKVEVFIDDRSMGVGEGRTKKAAEQSAARVALENFTNGEREL